MKTLDIIKRIFSCPTAPFREIWVLSEIKLILRENKIPYFEDQIGNIVAGISNLKQLKNKTSIGFIAHTDHPGFHINHKISDNVYSATWFGGAPFKTMKNSKVRIYDYYDKNLSYVGKITEVGDLSSSREGIPLKIILKSKTKLSDKCYGAFDYPGFSIKNDIITTRAADDLAGVVIALGALLDQPKKYKKKCFAIFTRAEEVGFIGCLSLLKKKIINPKMWSVSLEASKALPQASIKKGPVLRLGDRSTIFHSDFSMLLWKSSLALAQKNKKYLFQRRLMDGGSCEATALSLYKIPTTGLSVPLLNYHNQGNHRPAAEKISLSDVENARLTCSHLVSYFYENPINPKQTKISLLKNFSKLQRHLKI